MDESTVCVTGWSADNIRYELFWNVVKEDLYHGHSSIYVLLFWCSNHMASLRGSSKLYSAILNVVESGNPIGTPGPATKQMCISQHTNINSS